MGIAVLFIALVIGYGTYEYVCTKPLREQFAGLVKTTEPFVRDGDFSRRILVVGDSTAVGVGAAKPADSVPGRLAALLDASAENYAVSGARMGEVVQQFTKAKEQHYDLVLIQAGGNDIIKFTPLSQVAEHTQEVMERANAYSERVVLLTAGDVGGVPLWPRPLGWIYTWRTTQVRDSIQSIVESAGSVYLDLYEEQEPFTDRSFYAADLLHLSSKGYGVWFEHVRATIAREWPELL